MSIRLFFIFISSLISLTGYAQTCQNWLYTNNVDASVTIGDLDITGNKVTIEATFNRTLPWVGNFFYAGDLVSKHDIPTNVNYLLRPNNAEITTTNGYFTTPFVCGIELNKTYHVALVYDGTALKFYRNGILLSQVAASGNLVTNDFITTIGNYAFNNPIGTNFRGYINEVRIWNVARTQNELLSYLTTPLPNPTSQIGLLAYYTFDNLLNKQGNTSWNGILNGSATINNTNPICNVVTDSCGVTRNIPTVVNSYTPVIDFDICRNILEVSNAYDFNVGDTVLIMQMQGAAMNINNNASFGNLSNVNSAGNYEFNYIHQKNGNLITLKNKITRSYNIPNGKVQLIRVPYFENLNVSNEITCLPWDGQVGGVIAFEVQNNLTLNANIDASSKGFRGGLGLNTFFNSYFCGVIDYSYPSSSRLAAEKGESVAILDLSYNKGRGAPINGGGGGQDHNSGGGGGGNGAVGGYGGYQWVDCPAGIDNRGIGGKPLPYNNILNKVFMGGGGGAGHCNNIGFNSSGGNGGGIIIIKARNIIPNNFSIISNGQNGAECTQNGSLGYCHEGMGGGGAGGSILLDIENYNATTKLIANGGKGADMNGENIGSLGPGGGGSGGVVWFKNSNLPAPAQIFVEGGLRGTNINIGNNVNGATNGEIGLSLYDLVMPIDTSLFKPNIDSVTVSPNSTSCRNFNFIAQGFTNSTPIVSWLWNFGDGSTATIGNINHNFMSDGTYNVRLIGTDVNGCSDTTAVNLVVESAIVDAGLNAQLCADFPNPVAVSLNATGNGNIHWSPASFFTNPANPSQTISLNSTTKLYATSVLSPNCTAIDSVVISINPTYSIAVAQNVCPSGLPFNWNGQSLTSAGSYFANLVSVTGCDSTVNLTLSITDTIKKTLDLSICNNQTPYNWNGQSISNSGVYQSNLLTSNGCDSLVTLNLTVTPVSTSFKLENICESQAPYNWNGQLISSSGNYQTLLTNSSGCDSLATLEITINPIKRSTTNRDLCDSELPFQWNGLTINNTGTYTSNLVSSTGCDSIATLNLTVKPFVTSQTNINICTDLLPYSWNGQTYSSSGVYVANLISSSGCDSIASLNLQVNQPQTSLSQITICPQQFPYSWNGLIINSAGHYTSNLRTVFDCDSIANLELIVSTVFSSTVTDEICSNQFPYNWNNLQISSPGSYTVNLLSSSGCDSTVTLILTAKPSQSLNSTSDTTICVGALLTLQTSSGFTNYQWTPTTSVNNPTISNPLYIGNATQQMMHVTATDVNGCTSRDSMLITLRPLPNIVATPDTAICKNEAFTLFASGGVSYSWTPSVNLLSPTTSSPTFTGNVETVFTVVGSDDFGCTNSNTVRIGLRTLENLVKPPNKTTCLHQPVELDGANGNNFTYTWTFNPTLSALNIQNPIASPVTSSTYHVKITDAVCEYDSTFNVNVTVNSLPNVRASKSNDIQCGNNISRLNASGATTYVWNNDPSLNNVNIRNPIASPLTNTYYIVKGTDNKGCSNTDTIYVRVINSLSSYVVPNAFTPNGDGLNDCFGIKHWGTVKNLKFIIYNRWGEMVFETNDVNKCWDGKYKGELVDAGNYVYYISGYSDCGRLLKRGNVVLIL